MNTKRNRKSKFLIVIVLILCAVFIYSEVSVLARQVYKKNNEKKELTTELNKLKKKEAELSDHILKLKDPEYAARYAREKYLYSKEGETIIKID